MCFDGDAITGQDWTGKIRLDQPDTVRSFVISKDLFSIVYPVEWSPWPRKRAEVDLQPTQGARVSIVHIRGNDKVGTCRVEFSERLQTVRIEGIGIPFRFDRDRSLPLALHHEIHLVPKLDETQPRLAFGLTKCNSAGQIVLKNDWL